MTDDTSEDDWIPDIHLTSDDQKILQSKEAWLSDRIICAGQILLKREFGDSIMGLQNTVIGQGRGVFKSVPNHQKFLQILNLAGKHWILVANIHPRTTSNANVRIYDSYKKKIVTSRALYDICCMTRPRSKNLHLDFMNVVLQPNSSDCGLFALANASALANNLDPVSCNWNVQEMRGHLYTCFETGRLAPFPFQPRKVSISRKVVRSKSEDVFCVCRLPEEPNDEFIPMVQASPAKNGFMRLA